MRGDIRVVPISAKEPKAVRIEAISATFENRQVYFPHEAPWLDECLREVLGFPSAKHDDVIDSIAQYLNWGARRGKVGVLRLFLPRRGLRRSERARYDRGAYPSVWSRLPMGMIPMPES